MIKELEDQNQIDFSFVESKFLKEYYLNNGVFLRRCE